MKMIHALVAATMLCAPMASAQELKLADFQPPTHFIVDSVYTPMSEAISAATGGELGLGPTEL